MHRHARGVIFYRTCTNRPAFKSSGIKRQGFKWSSQGSQSLITATALGRSPSAAPPHSDTGNKDAALALRKAARIAAKTFPVYCVQLRRGKLSAGLRHVLSCAQLGPPGARRIPRGPIWDKYSPYLLILSLRGSATGQTASIWYHNGSESVTGAATLWQSSPRLCSSPTFLEENGYFLESFAFYTKSEQIGAAGFPLSRIISLNLFRFCC